MKLEKNIISSLLQSRDAYTAIAPILQKEDFSIQGDILYQYIKDFYERDPACTKIDREILLSAIVRKHPKHAGMFEELLKSMEECSVINVLDEFIELKKHNCAMVLSGLLLNGEEKRIQEKLNEYQDLLNLKTLAEQEESDVLYQIDLAEFFKKEEHEGKIPVIPAKLNSILNNGIRRGHHIIIYAMPEVGKTLFTINFASGFCRRGLRVLYLANEEPVEDVLDRFLARFSGIDIAHVRDDPAKTQSLAVEGGLNSLILVKSPAGTPLEIEKLIKDHSPDVLVVDQIKNLDIPGCQGDETTTVIKASRFMRKMGKQYNLVAVSVTQAGDDAYNRAVLRARDIYGSKTSVSGDADLMIGIGMNESMEQQGRRMINLPKNKISGRHEYFAVEFDTRHTKVISL